MRLVDIHSAERESRESSSPVELLLACHTRIRHFVQMGRTLAGAKAVSIEEVRETAETLLRYFQQALPLHEADENESLFPRLLTLPDGNLVREAGEAMVEQHRAIHELVEELVAVCTLLEKQPARLPALGFRLEQVTRAMAEVFGAHLTLEESVIFPAIDELLTPEQRDGMLIEMRARRGPQPSGIHLVR
jgi:iron-sulfur cluster repair protein YtfE (RIC family)